MSNHFEKIPSEIPVYAKQRTLLREEDNIFLYGEIHRGDIKIWEKDIVRLFPEHVYNETLKCGFKVKSEKKLRKGKFPGIVTSVSLYEGSHGTGFMYFSLEFDNQIIDVLFGKKIINIPQEIFVDTNEMVALRQEDQVIVEGEIFYQNLEFWEDESFVLRAEHVHNVSLNL
ncbi:MAG: hypothetical protein ACTSRG_17045 [Candidatus Helarchaeota archaeon]